MNNKELTVNLVEKALKLGASSAEVYLETSRDLSISILNGEIETIEEASSAGGRGVSRRVTRVAPQLPPPLPARRNEST